MYTNIIKHYINFKRIVNLVKYWLLRTLLYFVFTLFNDILEIN